MRVSFYVNYFVPQSSNLSTESLMDSRLSSIAAEAILSSSHGINNIIIPSCLSLCTVGRDSFAVLERHIGLNKVV